MTNIKIITITFMQCPLEDARIKMVSDSKFSSDHAISAIGRIIAGDGVLSLFSSLSGMLAKQVPYTTVKQVSFDLIAKELYRFALSIRGTSAPTKVTWPISVSSAFITSILSCLASQPGDMILTTMCQGPHHLEKPLTTAVSSSGRLSAVQAVSAIYKTHGMSGFFIGTNARLFHVIAIVTSQLVIYDMVKQWLGLADTGSH